MKRRNFIALSAAGFAGLTLIPGKGLSGNSLNPEVRLGGPVFEKYNNPEEWIRLLQKAGYKSALCPVNPGTPSDLTAAYRKAAEQHDIVIAEVGAWSNPNSPDAETARQALQKCKDALALADEINARCCVNISGSRNPREWDGPDPLNLTTETFDLIVETTRKIIDAVKPLQTFYTLEMMPWMYPDSAESCIELIKAIDRKQFAVHLDPVNMVTNPVIYYHNGEMIRDAFRKLGPYIRSVHAKDILIRETAPQVQFDEVLPGHGILDYPALLSEIVKHPEIPMIIEHLDSEEKFREAALFIRETGKKAGISVAGG